MLIGNSYFEFPNTLPQLSTNSIYFIIFVFLVFLFSTPFKNYSRPFVLLIANIVFLYSFSVYHLIAVVIISLITYLLGLLIGKYRNKVILLISLSIPVFVLCFFKFNGLFLSESIIMPLGLSFYTFKIISYIIDIYKNNVDVEKNIIYHLDYVMFFPTITAGPIHRSKHFFSELRNHIPFDYKDRKNGFIQMLIGIFEKMVLCDYVGIIVNQILNNNDIVGLNVFMGIVLYSFQIYLDFDSYSNIAIGLSRLLGFHFEKNFNSPYLAINLKDFWRRWHISLSTWLRDYIYIPLGGSRKGKLRRFINLIIVFLVSGIWHGSTINFVLWGLLHAVIQIIEDLIIEPFRKLKLTKLELILLKVIGVIINFSVVTFLWLIFRYQTISEVVNVISRMLVSAPLNYSEIGLVRNEFIWLFVVLAITILFDILRDKTDMIELLSNQFILIRWLVYILLIVIFMIFAIYGGSFEASDFIYQFF